MKCLVVLYLLGPGSKSPDIVPSKTLGEDMSVTVPHNPSEQNESPHLCDLLKFPGDGRQDKGFLIQSTYDTFIHISIEKFKYLAIRSLS